MEELAGTDAVLDCGWGRLIFAHTFASPKSVAYILKQEKPNQRDIAFYLRDPHVVLSLAPQELFLDPSHTYRLWLNRYRPPRDLDRGFIVRFVNTIDDARGMYEIYKKQNMVAVDPEFVLANCKNRSLLYLVAQDANTGEIIGTVTGVDHKHVFDDPENGSSLWCLAVNPDSPHPGIGEALTLSMAGHFVTRGRDYMDLSVMHDNIQAIALYEKLGFKRVPIFCLKRKNPINQDLFIGPGEKHRLNPYARIIVDEARRRGIGVEILDEDEGYFALSSAGRSVTCREALSELTTAVAMSRCDNKRVTAKLFRRAGLKTPNQRVAGDDAENYEFLFDHGAVVVKPVVGEQGAGISVDIRNEKELDSAIKLAKDECPEVLLEQYVEGEDLRVVVINNEVVAAALRKRPEITGTGRHSIKSLIRKQSRRRAAATNGESSIPLDNETRRCIRQSGHSLDEILEEGVSIKVRKTANLHTGGILVDVTDNLSEHLRQVSIKAAQVLDIPVTGLDLLVPDLEKDEYVLIEANERPGLANHEPQPTAQRFVDFLFPETSAELQDEFAQ